MDNLIDNDERIQNTSATIEDQIDGLEWKIESIAEWKLRNTLNMSDDHYVRSFFSQTYTCSAVHLIVSIWASCTDGSVVLVGNVIQDE